jgi:hypothetical protein
MVLRDRRLALLLFLGAAPLAAAGDDALRTLSAAAPLANPHSVTLDLELKSRRRSYDGNPESSALLHHAPGLRPVSWPRNTDMRARLLTPELQRTPLVGWIATNLYRRSSENGWCLELDPGEGEYVVFYRLNLN